jgi:hypothetical protein
VLPAERPNTARLDQGSHGHHTGRTPVAVVFSLNRGRKAGPGLISRREVWSRPRMLDVLRDREDLV